MNGLRIQKVAAAQHEGAEHKTAEHYDVTLGGASIGKITQTSDVWVWRHSNDVFGLTEDNLVKIAVRLSLLNQEAQ